MDMTAIARRIGLAVAVAVMSSLAGCGGRDEVVGAVYSCDDYTVYPDSVVTDAYTLAVRGDSVIVRDASGTRVDVMAHEEAGNVTLTGDDGLIRFLFNRETPVAEGEYDALTPYEIYISDGLIDADSAAVVIDNRIVAGDIAECVDGTYHWPVATSDAAWGIAAATVSMMTDDDAKTMKRANAIKRLVDRDMQYAYDRCEGLFSGIPAEMSGRQLPEWAGAADMAVMLTLEGNISRLADMRYVNAVMPGSYGETVVDDLAGNIARRLWLPNLGMLSQTLYQRPYPVAVTAADNLVQGFAVATGGVADPMARRIISSTPVTAAGVPLTYPDQGVTGDKRREALTAAMWAIASARVKNSSAWALSYSSLVAMSVDDAYASRMLRGVTLRTIFGVCPEVDGLRFDPLVHAALGGYHKVSGLRYRKSELSVTVRGTGDTVTTFMIDGEVKQDAIVPGDMEGVHEVEIVLGESGAASDGINVAASERMPAAPEVAVTGPRNMSVQSDETDHFIVYLNGAINEIIGRNRYELYEAAPVTAVSFVADVSNIVTGYGSKNYLYIPATDSISIACKEVASTGGRVLAKKDLAAKHVESTRYKNSRLTFEYLSATGGEYYIRLRYLDGLGIVNKNLHYALRLLKVNGEAAGIMVLTQRGPEMWSPAEDWASMSGVTEPLQVSLRGGKNEIVVEYFAPDGVADFDHDANTVIPLALEIIERQ